MTQVRGKGLRDAGPFPPDTMRDRDDAQTITARGNPPRRSEPCDVCGGPTYETRCKIICRRCGFTRDCSDP